MQVLYLTIFFSVLFAATFIYLFITQHLGSHKSLEQQALLPLREDSNAQSKTETIHIDAR